MQRRACEHRMGAGAVKTAPISMSDMAPEDLTARPCSVTINTLPSPSPKLMAALPFPQGLSLHEESLDMSGCVEPALLSIKGQATSVLQSESKHLPLSRGKASIQETAGAKSEQPGKLLLVSCSAQSLPCH